MTTWRETNADRKAARVAEVKALIAMGASMLSAARTMRMSQRTLRRLLERNDRHDLVEALDRYPKPGRWGHR